MFSVVATMKAKRREKNGKIRCQISPMFIVLLIAKFDLIEVIVMDEHRLDRHEQTID